MAEIDAEWQAMVTADPMGVAWLPGEAKFRARLPRSGQLHDGWLDLAVAVDGEPAGRIQTFVPRISHSRRERSCTGSPASNGKPPAAEPRVGSSQAWV